MKTIYQNNELGLKKAAELDGYSLRNASKFVENVIGERIKLDAPRTTNQAICALLNRATAYSVNEYIRRLEYMGFPIVSASDLRRRMRYLAQSGRVNFVEANGRFYGCAKSA